jgi:hypothetical protein
MTNWLRDCRRSDLVSRVVSCSWVSMEYARRMEDGGWGMEYGGSIVGIWREYGGWRSRR